ncbi:MAG: radical SAM protein [Acidobacteriaceae bacterium]|nr:radical SAM protein [Acidobacteriaceae bacterium]
MPSPLYLPRVWMGSQISPRFLPSEITPLSAHIKLTENCQAKCISCNYWQSRWQDGIDTDRAIELINEIDAAGIRSLRLTGGEPLLRKDLFHVLATANTSRFKRIILQTNGLAIKKLHKEINASPITHIAVSIDGLKETNDLIRGIRGYFNLGMEGLKLLRDKKLAISVTLNRMSAAELDELADQAHAVGAKLEFNILSQSLFFLKDANLDSMWPESGDVDSISGFLRRRRPGYEVDYITRYYNREQLDEPPCVLGFLQVFVLSNGDVLTGCYPLEPVGNILRDKLATILASDAYARQAQAMIRRECPGCTCGVESSLAMKHGVASAFFELSRLQRTTNGNKRPTTPVAPHAKYVPDDTDATGDSLVEIHPSATRAEDRRNAASG